MRLVTSCPSSPVVVFKSVNCIDEMIRSLIKHEYITVDQTTINTERFIIYCTLRVILDHIHIQVVLYCTVDRYDTTLYDNTIYNGMIMIIRLLLDIRLSYT